LEVPEIIVRCYIEGGEEYGSIPSKDETYGDPILEWAKIK